MRFWTTRYNWHTHLWSICHRGKPRVPAALVLTDLHQASFIATVGHFDHYQIRCPSAKACHGQLFSTLVYTFIAQLCCDCYSLIVSQHCTLLNRPVPCHCPFICHMTLSHWVHCTVTHWEKRVVVHSNAFPQLTTLTAVNWVRKDCAYFCQYKLYQYNFATAPSCLLVNFNCITLQIKYSLSLWTSWHAYLIAWFAERKTVLTHSSVPLFLPQSIRTGSG